MNDARSKLRWTSPTLSWGILDLYLPILYGEAKEKALRRLLQEMISQSEDMSVLDWTGKASAYHTCLPANIESYQSPSNARLLMSDIDFRRSLPRVRHLVNAEDTRKFYTPVSEPRVIAALFRASCTDNPKGFGK